MKQIIPLTGLRGIAAYAVLIAHAISTSCNYGGTAPFQPFASRLAYFGMSLFFVLSGFVIHYNYSSLFRENGIIKGGYQFAISRFARLYPLYALALLLHFDSIPTHLFHHHKGAEYAYFTLTQSWFNLQEIIFAPAWSISTECFFYLSFACFFPLIDKINRPIAALTILSILTFLFLPNLLNYEISLLGSKHYTWITYYSPYTRIIDFICGILVSKIYLSSQDAKPRLHTQIGLIACILWCVTIIIFDPFKNGKYGILLSNFVYTPAIAPMLYICCKHDVFINRVLCHRYLIFMGEISYSVYLLGFMIMTGLGGTLTLNKMSAMGYVNSTFKIFGTVIYTTLIAYGSYHLLEKPCRKYIKMLFSLGKRKTHIQTASLDSITVS